jgi:hypothetical protein
MLSNKWRILVIKGDCGTKGQLFTMSSGQWAVNWGKTIQSDTPQRSDLGGCRLQRRRGLVVRIGSSGCLKELCGCFQHEASGCKKLYQLSMAPKLLNFDEDVWGFVFRSIEKQILARVSNFWYLLPNKRE